MASWAKIKKKSVSSSSLSLGACVLRVTVQRTALEVEDVRTQPKRANGVNKECWLSHTPAEDERSREHVTSSHWRAPNYFFILFF